MKGERYKEQVQRVNSVYVEFEDGEVFDSNAIKAAAAPGPKKPGTGTDIMCTCFLFHLRCN